MNMSIEKAAARSSQTGLSQRALEQYRMLEGLLEERQTRLYGHAMYDSIDDPMALRVFMEHHVFAVWDFMSLVKALQAELTCTDVPWRPRGDSEVRRFINDIVLGEESDAAMEGGYRSHFEMYIDAMEDVGADTGPIRRFIERIETGESVPAALRFCDAPAAAALFVRRTFDAIQTGSVVSVATAFAFGREEVIPRLFEPLVRQVGETKTSDGGRLAYYLRRHIKLDGEEHGDLSRRMLCVLCGDSAGEWMLATNGAIQALEARMDLWNGVVEAIDARRSGAQPAKKENAPPVRRGVAADTRADAFWKRIIYIVSAVVCGAVAFLILGPRPAGMSGRLDVSFLPVVNATLNSISTVLLLAAYVFIKKAKVNLHKKTMLAAFGVSAAFLVTYVIYHWFKEGPKRYVGAYRGVYLTILLSHIVLAVSILPLALVALYRGWAMQFEKHRKIARIAFPIWLYVSVTGVAIYWMLY